MATALSVELDTFLILWALSTTVVVTFYLSPLRALYPSPAAHACGIVT
jgi:hypothetical protein